MYVMEDFRPRLNSGISWLNEEWFSETLTRRQYGYVARPKYQKWLLKVLDGILPFLDAKDKCFTRFLSEVPVLDQEVMERVKKLARDPERVNLAVSSLQYVPVAINVTSNRTARLLITMQLPCSTEASRPRAVPRRSGRHVS
jgi:symplekin